MSNSQAGNIQAIRDWNRRYFYTKEEIGGFFTKLNSGLTAYDLTIVGSPNVSITMVENAVSDPQSYTITPYSNCIYKGLFFFHSGSTITLTPSGGTAVTHVLSNYVDTIIVQDLNPLVPVMTSDTTPSGICAASSVYGNIRPAWYAFSGNQFDIQTAGTFWLAAANDATPYIYYGFTESKNVVKLEFYAGTDGAPFDVSVKFIYSVDGINWIEDEPRSITIVQNRYGSKHEFSFFNAINCLYAGIKFSNFVPASAGSIQFYGY